MKNILTLALVCICFCTQSQQYLVRNVNLISMVREGIDPARDVFIKDGKIERIGTKLNVPQSTTVIDGTGKYLVPGFYDMHAHFFYEQGDNVDTCDEELKLMIANGLTTVRIACGDPLYLDVRKKVRSEELTGPELIITSPQLVGSWPWGGKVFAGIATTPKEGADLVRKYKAEGYDQIKITFMVKADVYDAIQETAREVGIKVVGHVGPLVKLPKALAAGQQVEHMDEFIDMLLPDTTYNHGQSVSDMNLWRKQAWETVPYLDENKIPELVRRVKESGIYVTPTNYFFYSFFGKGIDEQAVKDGQAFQYVPSGLKDYAWKVRDHYQKSIPPLASREKYIKIRSRLIHDLWKAGVPLMAGSDSPQWFSVAGFAIHDELENLVKSGGVTPFAALQMATINPATFMGFDNRNGTIAVGKEADLILLNDNPLEDITNTRKIQGVMSNNKWFDRDKLDQMLEEAKSLGK